MSNMCVSAEGYKAAETVRFAALSEAASYKWAQALLQIGFNAKGAVDNYKKLHLITSKALALEEDQFNHVKDTYWPAEEQMLNEFTQKTAWESQAVLAKRYAGRMWAPIAAQFAKEIRKLECEKPRYCGNAHVKRMQEMLVQRSATRANVTLLADRIAFFEVQAVEDTDHDRRKQAIALRQGLITQAASLMAQAASGFAGAQASSMGAINNAIQALGYARGQQNNAENRVGRDPWFHQQTAQGVQAPLPDMPQNMGQSDWEASQQLSQDPMTAPAVSEQSDWESSQYLTQPSDVVVGDPISESSYTPEITGVETDMP